MKTHIPCSIMTIQEAKNFLDALYSNDELFHPEDDANDSIDKYKKRKFTKKEAERLNKAMSDIHFIGFDPCEYILSIDSNRNNRLEAFRTSKEIMTKSEFAASYGIPLDSFYTPTGNVYVYTYGYYIEILEDGKYFTLNDREEYISTDLTFLENLIFESFL